MEIPPTVVSVARPIADEVTDYVDVTGRTESVETVDIRARVSGYLVGIHFKPGQDVSQGDLLFEIDPRPYQTELERALGDVARHQATLARLDLDFKRAERLLPTNAMSREDYDAIIGHIGEAKAAIQSAEAVVSRARLDLDFTKITAPIAGQISRELITVGNLVTADVTPLTSIRSINPIYCYFDLDERTVLEVRALIREGKVKSAREGEYLISMGLADESGFPHVGRIDFVETHVDPTTGTLRLRAVFDNQNDVLSPGLFARIRVPIGEPRAAIMVSERAIGIDQGQHFVFVVDAENKVSFRRVEVGALRDGLRVINEGLTGDEWVIVNGLQRVRPGATVEAQKVDMTSLANTAASAATTSAEVADDAAPMNSTPATEEGPPVEPATTPRDAP